MSFKWWGFCEFHSTFLFRYIADYSYILFFYLYACLLNLYSDWTNSLGTVIWITMSNSVDEVMIPPNKIARRDNDENHDRISDLPDCILLHILSLLHSKQVVQTCVLSKRWKHLWKRIPTLILHASIFSTVKKFSIFVSNIFVSLWYIVALHSLDLDCYGIMSLRSFIRF